MNPETEPRIPLNDLLVFHRLARSLTSSFDLDTILRTILEHMERFVHAELWALLMLDEESQELRYAISGGYDDTALRGLRVKVGEGVAGWVAQHGETLIVPESASDPRLETTNAKAHRIRSVIALPLRGRKGTHGVIEIFNARAGLLSDYDIAFLHILADHAAIAIENARDVAHIQQLTITDDATGLFNARHLYEVLERELMRPAPLSLAFIDLDGFKQVNDVHGHLVGSELLSRTGRRLRQVARKQDVCFRYGGDEFVVLMPDTGHEAGLIEARRVLHALNETKFRMKSGIDLRIGASIGLATAPGDANTVHGILGIADARMYSVKTNGRGHVRGASQHLP